VTSWNVPPEHPQECTLKGFPIVYRLSFTASRDGRFPRTHRIHSLFFYVQDLVEITPLFHLFLELDISPRAHYCDDVPPSTPPHYLVNCHPAFSVPLSFTAFPATMSSLTLVYVSSSVRFLPPLCILNLRVLSQFQFQRTASQCLIFFLPPHVKGFVDSFLLNRGYVFPSPLEPNL